MATTITTAMLDGLRSHTAGMIQSARYMIAGAWRASSIHSVSVQTNGSVHATFYITWPGGTTLPATRFQLLNGSGQVLIDRTEDVAYVPNMDRVLYRFKIGLSVGEA